VIRVVLADDHALVRAGIHALLEELPEVEVVGEAADASSVLALLAAHNPDVLLLDVSMPGQSGLAILPEALRTSPTTRIVMLSMYAEPGYVAEAERQGAMGYLLKDASLDELAAAVRASRADGFYMSQTLSERVRRRPSRGPDGARGELLARLTGRQREVLVLIAQGRANKEIAAELGLSTKTVETHRAELMDRLGLRDVPSLVRFAIVCGLLPMDP